MSSNRLSYDACAYEKTLQQSTGPLDYMLYTGKFENCAKCRIEFGVVGGNDVSLFSGNLVDLESDLRGQNRKASLCPSTFYSPTDAPKMTHQPSCQMQYYPKSPTIAPSKVTGCNYPEHRSSMQQHNLAQQMQNPQWQNNTNMPFIENFSGRPKSTTKPMTRSNTHQHKPTR
jgi:hypothetical protein